MFDKATCFFYIEYDYDLTNSKCTISGWGGLNDWSLNRWLVSLY